MDKRIQEIIESHKTTTDEVKEEITDNEPIKDYREIRKDSFIRLDRNLIRVLGLNNAVVFCHLMRNRTKYKQKKRYSNSNISTIRHFRV